MNNHTEQMSTQNEKLTHYEGLKAAKNCVRLIQNQLRDGQLSLENVGIDYPSGSITLTPDDYINLALAGIDLSIAEAKKKYGVQ